MNPFIIVLFVPGPWRQKASNLISSLESKATSSSLLWIKGTSSVGYGTKEETYMTTDQ
jgi:hypothetical protein